jgi:hypothetical protein
VTALPRNDAIIYPFKVPFLFVPPVDLYHHQTLKPLVSCHPKIKERRVANCYHAVALNKVPVLSTTASGVGCWERRDGGSAGGRVHVPSSTLPVSLRFTSCLNTLLTSSQCRAECFAHLHSSCLGIPLQRMDTWAHLCTYVIPFVVSLRVHKIFFQSVSSLLSLSKRCLTGAASSSQCTVVRTLAT